MSVLFAFQSFFWFFLVFFVCYFVYTSSCFLYVHLDSLECGLTGCIPRHCVITIPASPKVTSTCLAADCKQYSLAAVPLALLEVFVVILVVIRVVQNDALKHAPSGGSCGCDSDFALQGVLWLCRGRGRNRSFACLHFLVAGTEPPNEHDEQNQRQDNHDNEQGGFACRQ
jgi:hypothetical protein